MESTSWQPVPNDEHQEIVSGLTGIFEALIVWTGLGKARPGTNVSDRAKGWKKNYRCPDVAVFLRAFGNNEPLARAQLLGAAEDGLRDTEEVCHETASA